MLFLLTLSKRTRHTFFRTHAILNRLPYKKHYPHLHESELWCNVEPNDLDNTSQPFLSKSFRYSCNSR